MSPQAAESLPYLARCHPGNISADDASWARWKAIKQRFHPSAKIALALRYAREAMRPHPALHAFMIG
jgi:hypothetical protein